MATANPFPSRVKNSADWLADRILRSLIAATKALPYEKRVPAMGRLISGGIAPLAGYRRRAVENLTLIYPDLTDVEKSRIATAVCDNFGRTLIENYSYNELATRLETTQPSGAGLDPVQAAQSNGQPVIFVTGHIGNHEVPRHVLTRLGMTIGGLYRPMSNAYFDEHYAKTMTSWGGPVFAQGTQTRGFARHIKNGGMGTLLTDVHTSKGELVDFLGHPARTALSAAEIALKFGALLVPYYGIRNPDGLSFDVIVEAPIPHTDALTMTAAATNSLAAQVMAHPEQWFWVHRRWKQKSPAK